MLGLAPASSALPATTAGPTYPNGQPATVLYTGEQAQVAAIAMDVINDMSRAGTLQAPDGAVAPLATSAALSTPEVQAELIRRVQARVTPAQGELLAAEGPSVEAIVVQTAALVAEHTIDIPRILVKPKGPVTSGYSEFTLDVSRMNFQPQDQQLVGRGLQTGKELLYGQSSFVTEQRLEDYIVRELIGFDDISYDAHAERLYSMAAQAVSHFKTYLKTEAELHNVLANHGKAVAENVHAQMAQHYVEEAGEIEVVVSQGFTPLKASALTAEGDLRQLHEAPDDKSRIASLVYGGFSYTKATHEANIGPYASDFDLGDIYLNITLQQYFIHVSGQLNDCFGAPVTNGQIAVQYPGKIRLFPLSAPGVFGFDMALNCVEFPELQITGYDLATFKSTPVQFHSDDSDVDLGVLTACTDPGDYIHLTVAGTPYNTAPTRFYLKTNVSTNWMVLEGLTTGGKCSIELRQYAGVASYTVNEFFHLDDSPDAPAYPVLNAASPDITVNITADDGQYISGNITGTAYDVFNIPQPVSGDFKVKKEF